MRVATSANWLSLGKASVVFRLAGQSARIRCATLILPLLLLAAAARAQVQYSGAVSVALGSASGPTATVTDASGNLYVAENGSNQIVEVTTGGPTVVLPLTGLSGALTGPLGLAIDSSGNLYIADAYNSRVVKVNATGNASVVNMGTVSLDEPTGLAFDSSGNLYIADAEAAQIDVVPATGLPYTLNITGLTTGLGGPYGIAFDRSGNLYIADKPNSRIVAVAPGGAANVVSITNLSLSLPFGVAVDAGGNLYIADTSNSRIVTVPSAGGAGTVFNSGSDAVSQPGGVYFDQHGNLYIADTSNNRVVLVQPDYDFGNVNLGASSSAVSLTFSFAGEQTIRAPVVLTQAVAGLDFTDAGTGTCTTNGTGHTYEPGDYCTVNVTFTPRYPGLRSGAVQLVDNGGNLLATGYIRGTGVGPQMIFSKNNVQTNLGDGFNYPISIALDGNADVFLAEPVNADVKEILATGGYGAVRTLGGGYSFGQPAGVALGADGNLVVADYGNGQVDLILAKGGYTTVNVLAGYPTFYAPNGVAVDSGGNIFVTDQVNNAVYEMLAISGYSVVNTLAGGFNNPNGVAVDGEGNVYVADTGNSAVKKLVAAGGVIPSSPTIVTLGGGFSSPNAVAVDASGSVFVADSGHGAVKTMSGRCASSACVSTLGQGFISPFGVALSGNGNLFLVDYLSGLAKRLNFSSPPSLTFANTNVGVTSSASAVLVANDGNSALNLTASGLTAPVDYLQVAGSGTPVDCANSASIASGASCNLSIAFKPLSSGSHPESFVLTDNSLNVAGANQSISLAGTGVAVADATTVTFASLPSTLYSGQPATVSVTVADSTTPSSVPTGTVTFTDSVQGSLGSAVLSGGVASLGSIAFTGNGTHTITASYAGVSGSFASSSKTASITISSPPVATVEVPSQAYFMGNIPVGQTSSPQTVTFIIATTGLLGSGADRTLGASGKGKAFELGAGNSCFPELLTQIYTAGSTCTVNVTFAPKYPGLTIGAVQLIDQSGNLIQTAYVYGIGTGPEAATFPGTATSVAMTGSYVSTFAMAFDGYGNFYFADQTGNQVFKVPTGGGAATVVAGTGTAGGTGDGGPATEAELNQPSDVALDGAGNIYIADYGNDRVRMVSPVGGTITTVAGNGAEGYAGNGGAATSAELDVPAGLALDGAGNLYIADLFNNVIRKVAAATGIITTVAGNGTQGFSGDGGLATQAELNQPDGVAVDGAGNVYIADAHNSRVRMVSATSGNISTVAGNGSSMDSGDGGPATQAGVNGPYAVAIDAAGNLSILEPSGVVRQVLAASGIIETDPVNVGVPRAMREDNAGNLYVADTFFGGLYVVKPTTSFNYPTATAVSTTDTIDGPMAAALVNIGNEPLTAVAPGLTAPVDFVQAPGPGTPADCTTSFSLEAGAACTLAIEFEPTVTGALSESFIITDNSLNTDSNTQSIGLAGASLPAQAALTVTGVPSTAQPYGTTFTVGSAGGSGLGAVTFSAAGACSVSGITVTITSGSGTCSVTATKASDGTYAAAVSAPAMVAAAAASITLSANLSSLSFGTQPVGTTSAAQTVIVSNPGTVAIFLTSVAASRDFAATSNCGSIPAGGNCSIGVTFTPSSSGARTGTLTVVSPDTATALTVTLTGTGGSVSVTTTPANLVFGSQTLGTTSPGAALEIENTGTTALLLSNVNTTGDFSTAGNCAVIPAGTNCALTVNFTPTATGARTGAVTLTGNTGGSTSTQTIILSGSGTQAGTTLSTSSELFPSTLVGSTSPALTATLTNSSSAALTGISVSTLGDFADTTTCESTLAAGASCTISTTYKPTIAAPETGTLNITDNLGQQSIVLSGTGLAPGASLSPSQLLFGGQLVGATSLAQTVVFTNTGSEAVTFSSITLSSDFTDTTNCTGSISAGSSCSINVFFTPSAAGAITGTLTLTDTVGTQTISLSGVGVGAVLSISPSFVLFGSQQQGSVSQAQTLVVTNNSSSSVTLGQVAVTNNFVESDNCSSTALAAGGTCSISAGFAPSAAGTLSGSLTVASADNSVSTVAAFAGQGSGTSVAIQPGLVSFGSQTVGLATPAQIVTVWNTGSSSFTIGAVTANGDFSETDTCSGQTIAAGGNCVLSITMTPTTTGARTGTVQLLESIDGLQTITLSGFGQAAGVGLSTEELAFGSLPIVSAAQASSATGTSQAIVVTNSSADALTLTSIGIQGDFRQSNTCGSSLAAGATCTITVTFIPTLLGHRTGTLTLNGNAGGGQQTVSLAGDGSPVGLTLTPPILNFGLQTVGVTSAPLTAILSNNTGQAITAMQVSASGEYSETDNCGTALANASGCTLEITVHPTTTGAITGTISVSSNGVIVLGALRGAHQASEPGARARAEDVVGGSSNSNIGTVATSATTIPSSAPLARLAFGAPPAVSVTAGGNAGSSITVIEEDANGNPVSGSSTITLTVSGPDGYAKSYTAVAAGGTADRKSVV